MSPIVLVGVPGAGKSTVGALLAGLLGIEFVDSDDAIVEAAGKPISEIFIEDGEANFRLLEAKTISELLLQDNIVLALGGGAVTTPETRSALLSHRVIWLQAGLSSAVERVGLNRNRPLLLGNVRGQLHELMVAREPLYREVASLLVDTDGKTPELIASEISERLSEVE